MSIPDAGYCLSTVGDRRLRSLSVCFKAISQRASTDASAYTSQRASPLHEAIFFLKQICYSAITAQGVSSCSPCPESLACSSAELYTRSANGIAIGKEHFHGMHAQSPCISGSAIIAGTHKCCVPLWDAKLPDKILMIPALGCGKSTLADCQLLSQLQGNVLRL